MPNALSPTAAERAQHLAWLKELTAIPTAAGCEQRVVRWVERWASARPGLQVKRDRAGNLIIQRVAATVKNRGTNAKRSRAATPVASAPLYITAHLDHPAFVAREIRDDTAELEFRGGVHDPYFDNARIEIIDGRDRTHHATITRLDSKAQPFKVVKARLANPARAKGIAPGDVARWKLAAPVVRNGLLHAHACDDLAAVAAALAFIDIAHQLPGMENVGVLLTRAEEIGFVGAIAACRLKTAAKDARLICLENSRSFAESPIGAGAILRVGDRISVFEPTLTNRLTDIFLEHAKANPGWKWQRKLMPGGACEATGFSSFGYQSTCICLPLGNYHNMRDIDGVLAGKRPAKVGSEFISVDDFHGMVDMLILAALKLDSATIKPLRERMDDLFTKHAAIVGL